MSRPRHPNKHIEEAVKYAETSGWRFQKSNGHAWGFLLCPLATRDGCDVAVYSTPRVPETHARRIRQMVDECPHGAVGQGGDEDGNSTDAADDQP